MIAVESVIIWVWDPTKELTFDEQEVHEDGGRPQVEIILDRPLRGDPHMDEKMYCRQGLCRRACEDLSDRGGCMVAQIVETVTRRARKDIPGQKRVRVSTEVPRFKPEEVCRQFDEMSEDWRDRGITTRMCAAFCDNNNIALRVLYKNSLVYKSEIERHDVPIIVDHPREPRLLLRQEVRHSSQ
jgi:hypothetical protein